MPKHDIWLSFPAKRLNNVDTTIEIYSGGTKRGELHISQGTIDWKSRNKKTAHWMTWERFADLMDEEAKQKAG